MDNRVKVGSGLDVATEAVMQSMRTQMGHSCPDATTARIYAREFAKAALAARASDTGRSEAEAMREQCAQWHETAAREEKERARQFSPGSSRRSCALVKAADHTAIAAVIRALQPEGRDHG